MNFKMFFEKNISNPLRKQELKGKFLPPDSKDQRTKIDGKYRKVYEQQGIQVFLDRTITSDFSPNSYNIRMVKFSVSAILRELKGIIPNKKGRIIITDVSENPLLGNNMTTGKSGGFYFDKIIYIDEFSIDEPSIWKHEYAHYVADLIPKQTEPLLEKAYKELLDSYWRKAKKKRRPNLEPEDPSFVVSVMEAERLRKNISKKLGFPAYGLLNFHEFFAVLIENWSSLRNDRNTYKFKSLVKNVLTRL